MSQLLSFDDFDEGMRRLKSVYGEKVFPPERVELIRRAVQYVAPEIWQATVGEVISEHMTPPNVNKIREALYATRKKLNVGETDFWSDIRNQIKEIEKSPLACRHCLGSGVFGAYRTQDANRYLYTFLCVCRSGGLAARLPEHKGKIRQWDVKMRGEWHPEHESEPQPDASIATVTTLTPRDLNLEIGNQSTHRAESAVGWDVET
jgi:hypothetical protein